MKKLMIFGAAICVAMAVTGCKSSESAYKKAYEKAKAQERTGYTTDGTANGSSDVPTVAPVETQPTIDTSVEDNYDNVAVRQESVSVVNGAGVGSFGVRANAYNFQERLKNTGYDAQVAFNSGNSMYRVVAATFDSKASAVQSRNQLRSQYPDAWLLYAR